MSFVHRTTVLAVVLTSLLGQPALSQCVYEGRSYNSAEQLPSNDPCEFCMCYRDSVLCLAQPCPPPAEGCQEVVVNGFCCPRYDCGPYDIDLSTKNTSVVPASTNSIAASTQLDPTDRNDRSNDKTHNPIGTHIPPLPLLRATTRR